MVLSHEPQALTAYLICLPACLTWLKPNSWLAHTSTPYINPSQLVVTPFSWMLKPKALELSLIEVFLKLNAQSSIIFCQLCFKIYSNETVFHHSHITKVSQATSATGLVYFLHPYLHPSLYRVNSQPYSQNAPIKTQVRPWHSFQALGVNTQICQWLSRTYTYWPNGLPTMLPLARCPSALPASSLVLKQVQVSIPAAPSSWTWTLPR